MPASTPLIEFMVDWPQRGTEAGFGSAGPKTCFANYLVQPLDIRRYLGLVFEIMAWVNRKSFPRDPDDIQVKSECPRAIGSERD